MAEFAKADFALGVRLEDGSTERDNLISAAKQGNILAQRQLDEMPECPQELLYLWQYFCELSLTRDNYGWGATRLKYREILAWQIVRKVKLDAWELEAILELDDLFLAASAKGK